MSNWKSTQHVHLPPFYLQAYCKGHTSFFDRQNTQSMKVAALWQPYYFLIIRKLKVCAQTLYPTQAPLTSHRNLFVFQIVLWIAITPNEKILSKVGQNRFEDLTNEAIKILQEFETAVMVASGIPLPNK